jgi:phosphatidylserine decarboxylase
MRREPSRSRRRPRGSVEAALRNGAIRQEEIQVLLLQEAVAESSQVRLKFHHSVKSRGLRSRASWAGDAIVGACGQVQGTEVFQAKGFPYSIDDLFGDHADAEPFQQGCYATLRLTSSMYHRFHAPHDCAVERVTYISGDTWNVNPIALKRVQRLFCRNERAVLAAKLSQGQKPIALVAVAAILVASIRLNFLDVLLHLRYRGPNRLPCDAHFAKGEGMGGFEHGSTIIVFAPAGFNLAPGIAPGVSIRMGQALMRLPGSDS